MVAASPAAKGTRHESHWTSRAAALLGPLLYAAALSERDMVDVVDWVLSGDTKSPRGLLDVAADEGLVDAVLAGKVLQGVDRAADQERQSIWSATADVVDVYTTIEALEAATDSNFDPAVFVDSGDAVYVAVSAEQQNACAPLVVALIEAVRDAQYRRHRAATLAGQSCWPPVSLILDEVANVAPIASLPALVSEAGGQGLHVLAAVQDLSQVKARWGLEVAEGFLSLFGHVLVLGGSVIPAPSTPSRSCVGSGPAATRPSHAGGWTPARSTGWPTARRCICTAGRGPRSASPSTSVIPAGTPPSRPPHTGCANGRPLSTRSTGAGGRCPASRCRGEERGGSVSRTEGFPAGKVASAILDARSSPAGDHGLGGSGHRTPYPAALHLPTPRSKKPAACVVRVVCAFRGARCKCVGRLRICETGCGGGSVITVTPVRSPDYYLEQVARDRHDYLTGEGEAPGRWEGTWTQILGVSGEVGEVSEEQFRAMFEERHPITGKRLKKYENKKVAGWDVTFAPPKSISALWTIAPDHVAEQIREADRVARRLGLAVFERYACVARLGRNGVDRQPGLGFLVATFEHRLSRDGDPQLHDHQVVANAVEAADGRTAALDGTILYRWQKAADAVYQAALRAERTARLGVTWTQRNGVWEIDGIPPALCRLWSKRRAAIEAELAEHGTSGGRAAHAAALATRKPKVTDDLGDLRERLHDEAMDAGFDLDAILSFTLDRARHRHDGRGLAGLSDKDIIDYLVGPEGLTQKASGFGRRDVLAGIGALLVADGPNGQTAADRIDRVAEAFFADPRVIPLADPVRKTSGEVIRPRDQHGRIMREVCLEEEPRFTTASLLAAETELITRAKRRQHSGAAVVPDDVVARVIAAYNAAHRGYELDADQQAMVWQLCSSGNAVDVLVGKAGTGKSTALEVARQCFEAAGIPVIGVAPTANAARQLEKASGIPACTLDKLLVEVTNGVRELPRGVAVVMTKRV